ncbi:MAG: hypothetical protein IPK04_02680 [Bdellovibrionales bacterium]|jgi:hypothetical protein|nr:hypothetical protein [Bdellovibrionales bacterium]
MFIRRPRREIGQRVFELFFIYLGYSGYVLFGFSVQRLLNLLMIEEEVYLISWGKLFELFWMGARFDLVVIGFIGLPCIAFSLLFEIFGIWLEKDLWWTKTYLLLTWVFASIIGFLDLGFFALNHRHLQWSDHQRFAYFEGMDYLLNLLPWTTLILGFVAWIGVCIFIYKSIRGLCLVRLSRRFSDIRKLLARLLGSRCEKFCSYRIVRILFPLMTVAFFARGTLSAHHLELQHSEISDHPVLNELVLNPIWTMDKDIER